MNYIEVQKMRKEAAGSAVDDYLMNHETLGKPYMEQMSPQEMLYHGVGAIGGGALGYMLSRMVHRKPSGLKRALYTLGGAAAGGLAPYYLLRASKDENGMTAADHTRLQNAWSHAPRALQEARNQYDGLKPNGEEISNEKPIQTRIADAIPGNALWYGGAGALIDAGRFAKERVNIFDQNRKLAPKEVVIEVTPPKGKPTITKTTEITAKTPYPSFFPTKGEFKQAPVTAAGHTLFKRLRGTLGGVTLGTVLALLRSKAGENPVLDPMSKENLDKALQNK